MNEEFPLRPMFLYDAYHIAGEDAFYFCSTDGSSELNFRFRLPEGEIMTVFWGDGDYDVLDGAGAVFVDISHSYDYVGAYNIGLFADYIELTYICVDGENIYGDVSNWAKLVNLEYLLCNNTSISGDISDWSALTELHQINCSDTFVNGDVSSWSTLTNLTSLRADNTSVSGDIGSWSALTNITGIYINNTSVSGDISSWSVLLNLTAINCSDTSVSGNISSWSALTNLIILSCVRTSVSGDVSSWSTLTNLNMMNVYETSVGFSNTPNWGFDGTTIYLYNNNWTSVEVDNALASFAGDVGTHLENCTINIAGTNADRTAGSDGDVADIEDPARGNTLTVNE